MSQPLKALLVEDEENDALLICSALKKGDFEVASQRVETAAGLRSALAQRTWDVVIADYNLKMRDFTGLHALQILQESDFDLPFIIVSGYIGEDRAVEAMRSGANDYIMKDPRLARLAPAVRRALQDAEVRRARRLAEARLQAEYALRATIEKTIPSGIAVWDLEGKITYVNPAFCHLVGLSEPLLVGTKPPYEFWPAEERPAYLDRFWNLGKGASDPDWFEARFRRPDHRQIHVLTLTTRLVDQTGAQNGWLASFTDITPRKQAEEALQKLNAELENRVRERTADLNQALSDLQKAVAARKQLENELLDTVEHVRQKLGLELHDDLGQSLSGLVFMSKGLELKLKRRRLPETAQATTISESLQKAIHLTKGLTKKLVSWKFKPGTLVEALENLAAQNQKIFGVTCTFRRKGQVPPLSAEQEMHLYKIALEAMHNGIKHGRPKKVQLSLTRTPGQFILSVRNDGRPFPALDKLKAGSGLQIMNYRANVIGGKLEVRSLPNDGTEVVCTLPLPHPPSPKAA